MADQLLDLLYPEALDKAYCIAGESYLEGNWYTEARLAFEEGLKINPSCREARSGLRVLEKRIKEVTLMLQREYTTACAKQGLATELAQMSLTTGSGISPGAGRGVPGKRR